MKNAESGKDEGLSREESARLGFALNPPSSRLIQGQDPAEVRVFRMALLAVLPDDEYYGDDDDCPGGIEG